MSNQRRRRPGGNPNRRQPATHAVRPADPADPWANPEARAWRRRMNAELLPMIDNSAVSLTLWPSDGQPDAKIAVELGFTLMLGKPMVFLMPVGQTLPPTLLRLADEVIEYQPDELGTPAMAARIAAAAARHRVDEDEGQEPLPGIDEDGQTR